MTRKLRVFALATYPIEAAATRYRIVQFIEPLGRRDINVTFSPFLDARLFEVLYRPARLVWRVPRLAWRVVRRIADIVRAARADVVWIQREAMLFGPPVVEWIISRVLRRPVVLDLDDATYLGLDSPVYGRFARMLKWPGKTDRLIRWSRISIAGSDTVAAYAERAGTRAVIIPTVVDLQRFTPAPRDREPLVVGWIGTHSTFVFLEELFPLLSELAREHDFCLRIIGASRETVNVPGTAVEVKPWRLDDEVQDLQTLDIGLYPIPDDEWTAGKSGFKAIQYMAVGVPFVMSPVGVGAKIGCKGRTHFLARTDDEWRQCLSALLSDRELRRTMGREARAYAEKHFDVEAQADKIAAVIREAVDAG